MRCALCGGTCVLCWQDPDLTRLTRGGLVAVKISQLYARADALSLNLLV